MQIKSIKWAYDIILSIIRDKNLNIPESTIFLERDGLTYYISIILNRNKSLWFYIEDNILKLFKLNKCYYTGFNINSNEQIYQLLNWLVEG